MRLGDKGSLEDLIHEITGIPITALRRTPLSRFSVGERIQWVANRETKRVKKDKAHCLLEIFNMVMPLICGEEDNAFIRLKRFLGLFHHPDRKASEAWLTIFEQQAAEHKEITILRPARSFVLGPGLGAWFS